MNKKFDHDLEPDNRIVYVRPVALEELPSKVRAKVGDADGPLFAVHNAEGDRLALVRDRQLAFSLARQNDLAPVNVH